MGRFKIENERIRKKLNEYVKRRLKKRAEKEKRDVASADPKQS